MNESRSRTAALEFIIRVAFRTQFYQLRLLELRVKQALDARPLDFVKDSFCVFISDVQPGRWISVSGPSDRVVCMLYLPSGYLCDRWLNWRLQLCGTRLAIPVFCILEPVILNVRLTAGSDLHLDDNSGKLDKLAESSPFTYGNEPDGP